MSGYLATAIVLATADRPIVAALESIRGYLRDVHGAEETHYFLVYEPYEEHGFSEIGEPMNGLNEEISEAIEIGCGVRIDQELCIGPTRHFAELCTLPVGDTQVSFFLKLASSVMDAVYYYDRSMKDFDEDAKQGIIKLCLGLTRAAKTEGFLMHYEQPRPSPLAVQGIASRLLGDPCEDDLAWIVGGASQSVVPLQKLRRAMKSTDYSHIYASVSGLTIFDALHRSDH